MSLLSKWNINRASMSGILMGLVAVILIYVHSTHIENYSVTPKWIGISAVGIVLTMLRRFNGLKWTQFVWGLFVIQYIINTGFSYNIWDSLIKSTPLILAPIIANALIFLPWKDEKKYIPISLILALCILPLIIVALFQIGELWYTGLYSHETTYRFAFYFGHRNQFSQFLVLCIPVLVLGIIKTDNAWKKRLLFFTILSAYLVISLLRCRSALLVIYGVYPAISVLFFLAEIKRIKIKALGVLVFLTGIVAGLFLYFNPFQIPLVSHLFETGFGSGNERIRIWQNSIDIFWNNPFFGEGSGDWKIEILTTPLRFTQAEDSLVYFQRAHNDFVQIMTENGLIGLLLILLFFLLVIKSLYQSGLNSIDKYIIFAGILGFLVIANLSFPFEKIELLFLLMLLVAGIPQKSITVNHRVLR